MVFMPHWPKPLTNIIKYDLSRIKFLLAKLNNPHLSIPPVIYFVGTNGKGSSLAFLQNILKTAKYKIHSYTSPHLLNFNERISLNFSNITEEELYITSEEVRKTSEQFSIEPSFFEATTAIAFLAFSRHDADLVLLEAGMGARLDATNVIPNPLLSIITTIAYDHTEYLGNEIKNIAWEKSFAIRQQTPCVIGPQLEEVNQILFAIAEKRKSKFYSFEHDYGIKKIENGFIYQSKDWPEIYCDRPSLIGEHQFLNASNAITAAKILSKDFNISDENIKKGIITTYWPGRLHKVPNNVFFKNNIWIDGAHNEHGAQALSEWLKTRSDFSIILGITKNRDVKKFISHFNGKIKSIFTTNVKTEPCSYSAQMLANKIRESNFKFDVYESNNIEDALQQASKKSKNILITGSLYLISDIYKLFKLPL